VRPLFLWSLHNSEAVQGTFAFAHVLWTAWLTLSCNYNNSAIRISGFSSVCLQLNKPLSSIFCELRFWILYFNCFYLYKFGFTALGVFRSCGSDKGLCPLDPCHPLKSVDVNFSDGFAVGVLPIIPLSTFNFSL
jgi:hypothetical protein